MAIPIDFKGSNMILHAPKGHEDHIQQIPAFSNGKVCVTRWALTGEEHIEMLQKMMTDKNTPNSVFIAVFGNGGMPPIFVGSEDAVRSVVADYGKLWDKNHDNNE